MIGPSWLTASDQWGRRRLDLPDDWGHLELRTALNLDKKIIPVIVGHEFRVPPAEALPRGLQGIFQHHGNKLSGGPAAAGPGWSRRERLDAGAQGCGQVSAGPSLASTAARRRPPPGGRPGASGGRRRSGLLAGCAGGRECGRRVTQGRCSSSRRTWFMVCGVTKARRASSALDSPGCSSTAVSTAYWASVAPWSRSAAASVVCSAGEGGVMAVPGPGFVALQGRDREAFARLCPRAPPGVTIVAAAAGPRRRPRLPPAPAAVQ